MPIYYFEKTTPITGNRFRLANKNNIGHQYVWRLAIEDNDKNLIIVKQTINFYLFSKLDQQRIADYLTKCVEIKKGYIQIDARGVFAYILGPPSEQNTNEQDRTSVNCMCIIS